MSDDVLCGVPVGPEAPDADRVVPRGRGQHLRVARTGPVASSTKNNKPAKFPMIALSIISSLAESPRAPHSSAFALLRQGSLVFSDIHSSLHMMFSKKNKKLFNGQKQIARLRVSNVPDLLDVLHDPPGREGAESGVGVLLEVLCCVMNAAWECS